MAAIEFIPDPVAIAAEVGEDDVDAVAEIERRSFLSHDHHTTMHSTRQRVQKEKAISKMSGHLPNRHTRQDD